MRYLLDTDHCSYIQRGYPEVVRRLQSLPLDAEVMTSVITQAEMLAGIEQAPSARRRQELRTLYHQLLTRIADVLPVTSEVAEKFAEVITSLVRKGTPVPVNDMWIAAVALAHDLIVVSQDGHFQHVDGLRSEDWGSGVANDCLVTRGMLGMRGWLRSGRSYSLPCLPFRPGLPP